VARAQKAPPPLVGLVDGGSAEGSVPHVAAFRKGLTETRYVDGQNVTVEEHHLAGQYERRQCSPI
jgi:putative ABC transport system substrate-binding protein